MRSSFDIEALEGRTLFAGVILEATGRLGPSNTFMQGMADDITARLGGPAQVPQYSLKVTLDPSGGSLLTSIQHVDGTGTPQTSSSGEIIVLLDYYDVSANASFSSTAIGQAVASYLTSTPVDGVLLASLPIHEIALSRGTGILDGIALALGQSGVWVDQETYLDPNPIPAQGDPPPTIYDNVAFVDDYWRNDGTGDTTYNGNPVNGAYNLNVAWLDGNHAGWDSAHEAPTGYYIGTIDQNATQSGLGPIYSNWYGNTPTMPARDQTGFIYSDLVGAPRPLSGVWAASGGTGQRTATTAAGPQWGSVTDLAVTSGNIAFSGGSLSVSYLHQNRASADTVTFFLDSDRNPYNNNFAANLGSSTLAASAAIAQQTQTLSLSGVASGTYWLCAQVTDAQGHSRYAYNPVNTALTVQPSASISGTVFNDVSGKGLSDGEAGLAGRTVYVDMKGTGAYVSTDPAAPTDASGNYTIEGLPAGTPLTVRQVLPFGKQETAAPSSPTTLTPGQVLTGVNFATTQLFSAFSGSVFDDLNANGRFDAGEPGAAGRTVYIDLDHSGGFKPGDPSATTDSSGNYTIGGLLPGVAFSVREVVPAGTRETLAPAATVTLAPGSTLSGVNFATSKLFSAISGTVFDDVNGNGVMDAGEAGLAGQSVYVDLDGSNQFKPGDPSTMTDANGTYTISHLLPNVPLTVREVVAAGTRQTAAPAALTLSPGVTLAAVNFATTQAALVSGTVDVQVASNAPATALANGFEITLTQRLKHGKAVKFTAFTDANGNFSFGNVVPNSRDTVQMVTRKGFRFPPHAHRIYSLTPGAGQVLSGINFSELLIVTSKRPAKARK